MAEPQIVTTLRAKRDQIEQSIRAYEKTLQQARIDLAHVNATLAMFEADGDDRHIASYMDTGRILKKGEIVALCRVELGKDGPLDTRELARRVAIAKGLDGGDKVLVKAIAGRTVRALLIQVRRGTIRTPGKVRGVRVWLAQPAE